MVRGLAETPSERDPRTRKPRLSETRSAEDNYKLNSVVDGQHIGRTINVVECSQTGEGLLVHNSYFCHVERKDYLDGEAWTAYTDYGLVQNVDRVGGCDSRGRMQSRSLSI